MREKEIREKVLAIEQLLSLPRVRFCSRGIINYYSNYRQHPNG